MNFMFLRQNITVLKNISGIIGYVLGRAILFFWTFFIAIKIRRIQAILFFLLADLSFAASTLFLGRENILSILLLSLISVSSVALVLNTGIIRQYILRPLKKQSANVAISDTDEETLKNVTEAVRWLSQNKTGALITFERKTPRNEYRKNGTIINCPVTPEIIETIFYEGTRLHDGAIIIRGDKIIAAAVYYPPSTKIIAGKFGARHRAALGISQEVTDSVTIIVSEETGRIGIAHNGVMDRVTSDEFSQVLHNALR